MGDQRTETAERAARASSERSGKRPGPGTGRHPERIIPDTWSQYVNGGREWKDFFGGALDALRIFPPAYVSSFFGPPWMWLPLRKHQRYSEFGLLDVWRPMRTLSYLADIIVPSVPRTPPPFTPPLLQRLFWHPSLILPRGDHNGSYTSHLNEVWLYINGILTNDGLAQLNSAYVAYLFHRPITLIQNSTGGVLEDLVESALDKAWGRTREAVTTAFPVLYDALKDPAKDRVVLVAHSQGTIIASVMLRFMERLISQPQRLEISAADPEQVYPDQMPLEPADFEPLLPQEVAKLEVYCLANCATTMRYVTTYEGRSVPWIESYGNEFDIVARLGVIAPRAAQCGVQIDGPRYERKGAWGHFLNDYYLLPIERMQKKGRKHGPKTTTADPYVLLNPDEFPGETPRLYQYLNGGAPNQ